MVVRSWPILIGAGSGLVLLGAGVAWFALRLIQGNRNQILATGALVPEQQLTIAEAGEIMLLLETPRLQTGYSNFTFEIVDPATGVSTAMQYDYARAQGAVRGLSSVRIPFGRMTVAQPGNLIVRVHGLATGTDYHGSRILFSRPYLGRMVAQIVGIVICAVGALLCLILATWQIFPPQTPR